MKNVVELEIFVDAVTERLLNRIDNDMMSYESGNGSNGATPILLNELLRWFMADSIGEMAVSWPLLPMTCKK